MAPTLLLDLDGTLIDSAPDLVAALNRLVAPRGMALFDRAEIIPMIGDGARVLLNRAFAARNASFTDAEFDAYLADYTANSAVETRPFPGVVDTLKRFAAAGWSLSVCTNKPVAPTLSVLAALDLAPFFAAIGGGDSFPTRKHDPAHLLNTLALAGGSPDAAIMVGDHSNDVKAAIGAGITCIFAGWGYGAPAMAEGSAAVAQQFSDLPGLAERLLAKRA
jgi:phosphoglycolate phosphatase